MSHYVQIYFYFFFLNVLKKTALKINTLKKKKHNSKSDYIRIEKENRFQNLFSNIRSICNAAKSFKHFFKTVLIQSD